MARPTARVDDLIDDDRVEALLVATPVHSHHELASRSHDPSHGKAELVARLGRVDDARYILVPELVLDSSQAARRAVQHLHGARVRDAASVLEADTYSHVVRAVAVEVARSDRVAKCVAALGRVEDAGHVLMP